MSVKVAIAVVSCVLWIHAAPDVARGQQKPAVVGVALDIPEWTLSAVSCQLSAFSQCVLLRAEG